MSAQRTFAKGEISPQLYARTDVAAYSTALKTCRNFVVDKAGGANYRPGTQFCDETKNPNLAVRLIPFIFNNDAPNVYVMEFGNQYIRFYQNGALVLADGSPLPLEVTTPYVVADLPRLSFVQSGDVVTIAHHSYAPMELRRLAPALFELSLVNFAIANGPNNVVATPTGPLSTRSFLYVVTYVDAATGAESEGSIIARANFSVPTTTSPTTLTWDPVAQASSYNVYRLEYDQPTDSYNGPFAFMATVTVLRFLDTGGVTPDPLQNPPEPRNPFDFNNNPGVVGLYQQRRIFANTPQAPGTTYLSRVGDYANFRVSSPLQDDDSVTFALASSTIDEVLNALDLGKLILMASGAEWFANGDINGSITPTTVNAQTGSANGSTFLRPVKIDQAVLYVEALGTILRELAFNIQIGSVTFSGQDLTLFSTHLFDGYTIVDWAWQKVPSMVAWLVRSDGTLLGCTYVKEQQVLAWHRHDTDGAFENVCVVPEDGEHRVYVVVRRTINGQTIRCVERFASPIITDVVSQSAFLDSALEYDGRNAGAGGVTITLAPSTPSWTAGSPLILLVAGPTTGEFTPSSVGGARFLRDASGATVRVTITEYVNAVAAIGLGDVDVPVDMREVPITDWDLAVRVVSGLDHLEGKSVGVFADGYVVASPNDPRATPIIVSAGMADLGQPFAHIRVGLPYLGDLETLDIDTPNGPSLKESKMIPTRLGLFVRATRGIYSGVAFPTGDDPTEGLYEVKTRNNESPADPVEAFTGYVYVDLKSAWDFGGNVVVRQLDPVPLNVLALMPQGQMTGN